MPLNTQIIRDGEALKLPWGNFHIAAMALAAAFDEGTSDVIGKPWMLYDEESMKDPAHWVCYPDMAFPITQQIAFLLSNYGALSKTPLNNGSYTLTSRQKFINTHDGEVLELLPGDVLHAWRM